VLFRCLIFSISLSTNLLKVPCGERQIRISPAGMTPIKIFNMRINTTNLYNIDRDDCMFACFYTHSTAAQIACLHMFAHRKKHVKYLWDDNLRSIVLDQGLQCITDQIHCSLTVVLKKQSVRLISCNQLQLIPRDGDEREKHEEYENRKSTKSPFCPQSASHRRRSCSSTRFFAVQRQ
jgi:hypothetical protein